MLSERSTRGQIQAKKSRFYGLRIAISSVISHPLRPPHDFVVKTAKTQCGEGSNTIFLQKFATEPDPKTAFFEKKAPSVRQVCTYSKQFTSKSIVLTLMADAGALGR